MQLLAPDILAEAHGLSVALSGLGLTLGVLLWLFGWWGHRFWIVLSTTVAGGTLGLFTDRAHGVQPLVTGLLLAVAAGLLALALVRVLAFVAGGVAICLATRALTPGWDQPLIAFLAGGLVGVLLFRVWTMALTSMTGTLLMGYSGLCLADRLGKVDAAAFADQSSAMLNWVCVGVALLGLLVQYLMDRWRIRYQRWQDEMERTPRYGRRGQRLGWGWGWNRSYRRAA